MKASALDVGGSRARVYEIDHGEVVASCEIWLPQKEAGEPDEDWGQRRVEAIAGLVESWGGEMPERRLPTACAGRKDPQRGSVTLSFYASPLPALVSRVKARTGILLGPLYDDDVCAGWGHLASPRGGLSPQSGDTILLTAGTGLAECLWVDGDFLPKGSYPPVAELGLEERLRADGWKDGDLPLEPLTALLQARGQLGRFSRVVLSGRFTQRYDWPTELLSGVSLSLCPLDEAPALGALALQRKQP